ncbi:hypothetical protein C8J56DRAFT_1051254 [Mycena floridula]|nr:hypothetical protein C8J56DRAFT_1051254 [Mycena floridula]
MVLSVDTYDTLNFVSFIEFFVGLYFWEFFLTLDFDFAFICGRRKLKWPMFFYFYARYAFLGSLVGAHSALWASSVSLSIRTMTLWGYSRRIMIIILPLIAFHLVAVCLSSTWDLKIVWSEHTFAQPRCVVLNLSHLGIVILYTYTVALDFIILCLTSYKLLYDGGARIRIKRIPIFMLLFRDGLVYFIVVFIMTLLPVVFLLLNNNAAMAIGMHGIPGTATIVAGSAVRRLYNCARPIPETTRAGDRTSLTIPDIPDTCNIRTESEIP